MAHKFSELRSRMSPQAQTQAETKAKKLLAEMPLNELRQARGLSQKMLAELLHVQQPAIAKMEKRTDMYLYLTRCSFRFLRTVGTSVSSTSACCL